jgi:phosphatidate cytidylyltransferase
VTKIKFFPIDINEKNVYFRQHYIISKTKSKLIENMLKNLVVRTISGVVFAGIMIAAIWFPPFLFGAVFLLITVLGLREFYVLSDHIEGVKTSKIFSIISGAILFLYYYSTILFYPHLSIFVNLLLCLYILSVTTLFLIELFRNQKKPIQNIAISLMGHIYIAIPFGLICLMGDKHKIFALAFFLIIWASDTGAYLVGICIGKHKMFERISPKKTWEGFFGGMIFALATGFIFSKITEGDSLLELWQWLVFALTVFVFGTLGDLVESMFKRSLNVKDSGSLMPGHGGLLDRFDSAIIAAPAAFVFLTLC